MTCWKLIFFALSCDVEFVLMKIFNADQVYEGDVFIRAQVYFPENCF